MYRIVIMSGKAFGKEVNENISFDSDGQTLANEGNIVIYVDDIELVEKQLGLEVQMV